MPRLPFDEIDVLVVDRMGKEISGDGDGHERDRPDADPRGAKSSRAPRIQHVIVLDLTEESHGNAIGIGLADIATERLLERIDRGATYENILTSRFLERAKVPLIRPHDRAAVEAAVRCNWGVEAERTRLVRILNTLHLDVVQGRRRSWTRCSRAATPKSSATRSRFRSERPRRPASVRGRHGRRVAARALAGDRTGEPDKSAASRCTTSASRPRASSAGSDAMNEDRTTRRPTSCSRPTTGELEGTA